MTKKEFAQLLSAKSGVAIKDAENVLSAMGETLSEVLATGESVFIRGFGTFKTVTQKARPARNITKGEQIWVEERKKPVLKFGDDFIGRVR